MIVGTCRLELLIPAASSLKDKRRVVKSLLDRVRRRYNVSAAEVADREAWQAATIGVACVSDRRYHADRVLGRVVSLFDGATEAVVRHVEVEFR